MTNGEQERKRTPFSARLPQVSLNEALEPVRALAELGAPATPHVIAQHAGTSYASNSRFRTRLGAAGYYGLIKKDGDKRSITGRGKIITGVENGGDPVRARREAVMGTSFGPLIHSLRGRSVNESAISLRLQSEHGVPETSAAAVTRALIESATQTGLIDDGRFDAVAIEEVANAITPEAPAPAGAASRTTPRREQSAPTVQRQDPSRQRQEEEEAKQHKEAEVEKQRPFVPGVQVLVKIDASSLGPQEIAELVRALQSTT